MDENQSTKRSLESPSRCELTAAFVTSRYFVSCVAIGLILVTLVLVKPPRSCYTPDDYLATNHELSGHNIDTVLADRAAFGRADVIPVEGQIELPEPAAHFVDENKARVLIVRGVLTVFSLGMDSLAKKLRAEGYEVQVTTAASSNNTARKMRDQIAQSNHRHPPGNRPLVIIGHSLGGDLAPKLASTFGQRQIPVDVLIMLDSTMPSSPPDNVKRCINLYQSNLTPDWARVFRGTDVQAKSSQTEMINIDIRKMAGREQTAGINHFNIDANPWIQDWIVDAVKKVDVAKDERHIPGAAPIGTVESPAQPPEYLRQENSRVSTRRGGKWTVPSPQNQKNEEFQQSNTQGR